MHRDENVRSCRLQTRERRMLTWCRERLQEWLVTLSVGDKAEDATDKL